MAIIIVSLYTVTESGTDQKQSSAVIPMDSQHILTLHCQVLVPSLFLLQSLSQCRPIGSSHMVVFPGG